MQKNNLKILNIKMSTKGGPVFIFSLPGEAACPPCLLHYCV